MAGGVQVGVVDSRGDHGQLGVVAHGGLVHLWRPGLAADQAHDARMGGHDGRCSMAATWRLRVGWVRPSLRAAADSEPVSAVSRNAFS